MKSWLYSSSFKTRVWLALVFFTLTAIWVSGTTSYYIASVMMERKAYALSQNTVNKSAQALEEKLRKIRLAVLTFMSSQSFNDVLTMASSKEEVLYYDYFKLLNQLQTSIFQMKLIESSIESILIHTPAGEFYATNDDRLKEVPFKGSPIYEQYNDKRLPGWLEAHTDPFFGGNKKVLSLMLQPLWQQPVRDTQILVNVGESSISGYLTENTGNEDGATIVFNESRKLAFETGSPLDGVGRDPAFMEQLISDRGNFEYTFKDVDYFVNYSAVSFPDRWMVVTLQSKAKLLEDIQLIKWMTMGTMLIFMLFALWFTPKVTRTLLIPLNKLQFLMKRVEQDDLTVRFSSKYQDEMTQVGWRFNSMLDRIQQLILEVMEVENQKRLAEIKALQAQIDPHFLYNTLNMILWKSEYNDQENVRNMIISLSLLFRLGLNNGNELTTVERELEHVIQYLRIQEQCYEDLFEYSVHVEEEVKSLPVLKLLLQPLVENVIIHGLKDVDYKGEINLSLTSTSTHLLMSVRDNGRGFDTSAIWVELTDPLNKSKSYALRNIYNRLILYYGDEASMYMNSVPFQSTMIELRIPLHTTGKTFIQN
ncbi:sensor histidine kinase [Paenibacillus puerhi]|uniref:sensor histidine kinase n=1 Tax=Paenibacillus puerhi TaxID=2692622 RepID=UPI00135774A0|nr:sensor histidine kinase [Paenibacillus puerhi]